MLTVTNPSGMLRLLGDRLVVRDSRGRLVRRLSRQATAELLALAREMGRDHHLTRYTPDGSAGVQRIATFDGAATVWVNFMTGTINMTADEFLRLEAAFIEHVGDFYLGLVARCGGFDHEHRLVVRKEIIDDKESP